MEEITHVPVARPEENAGAKEASATGALRLHQFVSNVFRNTRMVRVWLPPGYEEPRNQSRRYPALYLNDGQNLFDPATAFNGVDWHVGETAKRLIGQGIIPPLVMVGIDHAQNDRMKEYLAYRSLNPCVLLPQGKHYPHFLVNEVMPFVSERYRIAGGPDSTGLGGSSLGALISLYTVIERPGMFGRLLLESPSLFTSKGRILRRSRAFRHWPEKVFLGVGTRESGREDNDRQTVEDVRTLERILRTAGLDEKGLLVRIEEGAAHSESAWARRFPQALEFLFGKDGKEQAK